MKQWQYATFLESLLRKDLRPYHSFTSERNLIGEEYLTRKSSNALPLISLYMIC